MYFILAYSLIFFLSIFIFQLTSTVIGYSAAVRKSGGAIANAIVISYVSLRIIPGAIDYPFLVKFGVILFGIILGFLGHLAGAKFMRQ